VDELKKVNSAIKEHKEEVQEHLDKNNVKFRQKNLERQYQVNADLLRITHKAQRALKRKDLGKVKKQLAKLEDELINHEENLLIADESEFGWLTVSKIRDRKFLSSTLQKQITKVDAILARSKNNGPPVTGGAATFPARVGSQGGPPQGVITRRPQQKSSPEELLADVAKRTRAGNCTFCGEPGHWYRECAPFWEKVKESRAAWSEKKPPAAAAATVTKADTEA